MHIEKDSRQFYQNHDQQANVTNVYILAAIAAVVLINILFNN
jgi:hypothetical protein